MLVFVDGSVYQWHSDGGFRSQHNSASCACTLTRLHVDHNGLVVRKVLFAQSLYLGPNIDSLTAEVSGLKSALLCMRSVMKAATNSA